MALSSAFRTLFKLGIVAGPLFVLARLIERLLPGRAHLVRYYFVAQPVTPAAVEGRRSRKLIVRRAMTGDKALAALPRPAAVIQRRIDRGDVCFVAEISGQISGCLWLANAGYPEDEVRCDYVWQPGHAAMWDYDVYVAPAFRLSRTFASLWEAAFQYLDERGIRWTLSRISAFNPESLAAHARLGARRVGAGTFLVLGPLQIACLSVSHRFHLSIGARSRPQLLLPLPSRPAQDS